MRQAVIGCTAAGRDVQQRRHGAGGRPRPRPVRSHHRSGWPATSVRPRTGSQARRGRGAKATTDACGTQPRKADGSYWSCTFVDDFNGTTLDRTKWVPQTVFATGDARAATPATTTTRRSCRSSGGTLNLSVRKNATALPCANGLPATPYRAGSVSTYHLFSQQYGRFEARFRTTATTAPGLQESWWLWPDDRDPLAQLAWPLNGEIDIAETYSNYPDLGIPFLHYGQNDNGGPIPGTNTAWSCAARARGLQHLHAGVDRLAARDPRQRPDLPGQHLGRQRVPQALHPQPHPGARHAAPTPSRRPPRSPRS